jgi:hypothetical protein
MMSEIVKWDCAKVGLRVAEIQAKHAQSPPPVGHQMTAFTDELSDLPVEWRGLALQILTAGYTFGVDMNAAQEKTFKRESLLCGVGIVLLLVGVGLTFASPNLNTNQSMSCCVLISLGVAGFLVFLPGFLMLQGRLKPNGFLASLQFKGGGAVAIFLLVFLFLHYGLKY